MHSVQMGELKTLLYGVGSQHEGEKKAEAASGSGSTASKAKAMSPPSTKDTPVQKKRKVEETGRIEESQPCKRAKCN